MSIRNKAIKSTLDKIITKKYQYQTPALPSDKVLCIYLMIFYQNSICIHQKSIL